MKRIAIFVSGRGSNMQAIARECREGVLKDVAEISVVFSNKPEAAGLVIAQELGLQTASIASKGKKRLAFDREVIALIKNQYDVDYIVLAGYMRILSEEFVAAFPQQIINIHPADTTQHQGLAGYDWAFENKLEETKVTVHYVDEGLDTGAIIAQGVVDLRGATTLEEVEKRGLKVEHEFYSTTLRTVFLS